MDSTALQRQNRRIERLKAQGVGRSTVLVHEDCRSVLDSLRPHFLDPGKAKSLLALVDRLHGDVKPTNVAQVRHLSPFRYPGGKTWLVPEVREWLQAVEHPSSVLVEPFAGGAIAGLSAAAEKLVERVFLCELDDEVAAVWETIFHGSDRDVAELSRKITNFEINRDNVRKILNGKPRSTKNRAFRTIVKNRVQRGGIMAAGAGLVKDGEVGKGLRSRWYPETLVNRIKVLRSMRERIDFEKGDAFEIVRRFANDPNACFFIDPPYTAGGKKAGSRLYTHNNIDHEKLFSLMADVRGSVMMTYDNTSEVSEMAETHGFRIKYVPMKNSHHSVIFELLVLKP